jgi:hypothetical protein
MKTTIRTLVSILCLVLATGIVKAGEEAASPVNLELNLKTLIKSSVTFMNGSAMNTEKLVRKMKENRNTAKVCACEILKLRNNNDQFEQVAVFAEKTNYGDLTADYKKASLTLNGERKHMKAYFFDVVEVTQKITAPTDCLSLYLSMKSSEQVLILYDILDADINRVKQ